MNSDEQLDEQGNSAINRRSAIKSLVVGGLSVGALGQSLAQDPIRKRQTKGDSRSNRRSQVRPRRFTGNNPIVHTPDDWSPKWGSLPIDVTNGGSAIGVTYIVELARIIYRNGLPELSRAPLPGIASPPVSVLTNPLDPGSSQTIFIGIDASSLKANYDLIVLVYESNSTYVATNTVRMRT